MKIQRIGTKIWEIFLYFVLTAELFCLADAAAALCGHPLNAAMGIGAALLVLVVLCILKPLNTKAVLAADTAFVLVLILTGAALFGIWRYACANSRFVDADNGKAELFGNKKVMLFAPHEDDDICIGGGVIEEFKKYGSDVKVVFITNGDSKGSYMTETRHSEALEGAALYGVDERDVIFLGYGDSWQDSILWGDGDEVHTSTANMRETYGSDRAGVYKNAVPYSRNNLLDMVTELIRDFEPDIIIACDNDFHEDHIITSLITEEAVGSILRENGGYNPVFLKCFSYYTAYYAIEDYYDSINILSTTSIDLSGIRPEYSWENRVRFPVCADSLSRSLFESQIYSQLKCHKSQLANHHAQSIINGDKVCWQRRTDSLCAAAKISTSSGEGEYLRDMLLGYPNGSIYDMTARMWIPTDDAKTVTITFDRQTDVDHVVLYDSKDINANVLEAEISFDDGSVFRTGALKSDGAGDIIKTDVKNVGSMTVRIIRTEGDNAGLTEIEAFKDAEQPLPRYLKICDKDGNFVYDYFIDESGSEEFLLWGENSIDDSKYEIAYVGKGGASAEIRAGKIIVSCPKNGSECIVTIADKDGSCSDTVRFVNAGKALWLGHALENFAVNNWQRLKDTISYKTLVSVYHLIGGQNIVF